MIGRHCLRLGKVIGRSHIGHQRQVGPGEKLLGEKWKSPDLPKLRLPGSLGSCSRKQAEPSRPETTPSRSPRKMAAVGGRYRGPPEAVATKRSPGKSG